jgi:hypothetical protein
MPVTVDVDRYAGGVGGASASSLRPLREESDPATSTHGPPTDSPLDGSTANLAGDAKGAETAQSGRAVKQRARQ